MPKREMPRFSDGSIWTSIPETAEPMPFPKAIFLDTCVFDGCHYHFENQQLKALVEVARAKDIELVVPAVTNNEIVRHIRERSRLAVAGLKHAFKQHPFLRHCPALPNSRSDNRQTEQQVCSAAFGEWQAFLGKLACRNLDYSGIDVSELMRRYEQCVPPFGEGDKRKEFPDTVVFLTLRRFAEESGKIVAVVSADRDFKTACASEPKLIWFPNLPLALAAILATDAHFASATVMVGSCLSKIKSHIMADFADRGFDHRDDPNGRGFVELVEVENLSVDAADASIVSLGHNEFTISLPVTVQFHAHVGFDDADSSISGDPGDDRWYLRRREGIVQDEIEVNVIARFDTNEAWTEVGEAAFIEIEEDNVTMSAEVPIRRDDDE